MKKISSSMTARATIGALFFVISVFLVVFALFTTGLRSATPSAGTLNPGGATVNWAGTATGGSSLDESTCVEGVNCDTFILTLSGTPADWTGLKARLTISCADPSGVSDYDLRSEERRVGKECRSAGAADEYRKQERQDLKRQRRRHQT